MGSTLPLSLKSMMIPMPWFKQLMVCQKKKNKVEKELTINIITEMIYNEYTNEIAILAHAGPIIQ